MHVESCCRQTRRRLGSHPSAVVLVGVDVVADELLFGTVGLLGLAVGQRVVGGGGSFS